jgi:integrase/recombinase XerD
MSNDTVNYSLTDLISDATVYMDKLNYSRKSILDYNRLWKHFLDYSESKSHSFYSSRLGDEFLEDYYKITKGIKLKPSQVYKVRIIRVLYDYIVHGQFKKCYRYTKKDAPNQFKEILSDFSDCGIRKGLHPNTVMIKYDQMKLFMEYLDLKHIDSILSLNSEYVLGFTKSLYKYSNRTKSTLLYTLREFLTFLFENRYITEPLGELFHVITTNRYEKNPSLYSKCELNKIVESINRNTATGCRDYAMMILAIQLDMRVSDIKNLKIEHIKWDRNCIEFSQRKTGNHIQLPLPGNLKFAIIDYIKNSRPASSDYHIFLRHRAPLEPFVNGNKLYGCINKYIASSGIATNERKHGMHSMRSSLAGNLLVDNTPIYVITGILGHDNFNSTKAYIRIDIEQLRKFALEVPYEG